jgi:hypothetical protein
MTPLEYGRLVGQAVASRAILHSRVVSQLVEMHYQHGVGPEVAALVQHATSHDHFVSQQVQPVYGTGRTPIGRTRGQMCEACERYCFDMLTGGPTGTPRVGELIWEASVLYAMGGGQSYDEASVTIRELLACDDVHSS